MPFLAGCRLQRVAGWTGRMQTADWPVCPPSVGWRGLMTGWSYGRSWGGLWGWVGTDRIRRQRWGVADGFIRFRSVPLGCTSVKRFHSACQLLAYAKPILHLLSLATTFGVVSRVPRYNPHIAIEGSYSEFQPCSLTPSPPSLSPPLSPPLLSLF